MNPMKQELPRLSYELETLILQATHRAHPKDVGGKMGKKGEMIIPPRKNV
jgi:hypothetical protein